MKQCCMLRDGRRCTAMVPGTDRLCAACSDALERELERLAAECLSKQLRKRVGGGLG